MKIPPNLLLIFIFLSAGALFFFKSYTNLDPDFGWHLKMGQLILTTGIPKTDPFSFTMSSFPFVDHEWLTNIIYYILHQTTGPLGLPLLYLTIGIIIVLVLKSQSKSNFFLGPFLLSIAVVLPFWGSRPQIATWLLTAILLRVISDNRLWTKLKWLSPLYFLIWANLHGGFPLGLLIVLLSLVFKSYARKKILFSDFILTLACFVVTLINPYGLNLWKEIWQSISDSNLRWSIAEWFPLVLSSNWAFLSFTPLFALSMTLVLHLRHKLPHFQVLLYTLLLLASLSSQRHTPLWVLVALPLTAGGLNIIYKKIHSIKYAQEKFNIVYRIFVIASSIFVSLQIITSTDFKKLDEDKYYPKQAIQFLRQLPADTRIFNEYGWGGYLIWKMPEKKYFIDGRMPSWRWKPISEKESYSAFDEYNKVLKDPDGLKILDKYQITYVLWPTEQKSKNILQQQFYLWQKEMLQKLFKTHSVPSLQQRLEKASWQKTYQDPVATIYKRP